MATIRAPRNLGLALALQPQMSPAATRELLYRFAAEAMELSPTWPRLREWAWRLNSCRPLPASLAAPASLTSQALKDALTNEIFHQAIWSEFDKRLAFGGRQAVKLFSSDYVEPDSPSSGPCEKCPWDPTKPCPFPDSYCVDRQGAPCDHAAAALSIAARLWGDVACARKSGTQHRATLRCRLHAREHLNTWAAQAADALFQEAQTDFYQAIGLLIGALIESEQGAEKRKA